MAQGNERPISRVAESTVTLSVIPTHGESICCSHHHAAKTRPALPVKEGHHKREWCRCTVGPCPGNKRHGPLGLTVMHGHRVLPIRRSGSPSVPWDAQPAELLDRTLLQEIIVREH